MKKIVLAALAAALATAARAEPVTIKLGTLAPQGSSWHDILKELGQRWEQLSGGQVSKDGLAEGGGSRRLTRSHRDVHAYAFTGLFHGEKHHINAVENGQVGVLFCDSAYARYNRPDDAFDFSLLVERTGEFHKPETERIFFRFRVLLDKIVL